MVVQQLLVGVGAAAALLGVIFATLTAAWLLARSQMRPRVAPGDIFEDCGYHLCYCTASPVEFTRPMVPLLPRLFPLPQDYAIEGISLVDGSSRSCSQRHCAPRLIEDYADVTRLIQGRDLLLSCQARWEENWDLTSYAPWAQYMGWPERDD